METDYKGNNETGTRSHNEIVLIVRLFRYGDRAVAINSAGVCFASLTHEGGVTRDEPKKTQNHWRLSSLFYTRPANSIWLTWLEVKKLRNPGQKAWR